MVLSIIASAFTLPQIVFAGIGIGESRRRYGAFHQALYFTQMFIALAQAVIAITTAAFSCRTVCCGKRSTAGAVIFNPMESIGNNAGMHQFTAIPLNAMALPTTSTQQTLGKLIFFCEQLLN